MKNFLKTVKAHKVLSSVIISVCAVGIVGGGFAFGIHQANIDNTKKALNFAKDGYVDEVELNQLGEDIVLGEEIVLDDGTVVVVAKDENGNYVTHTTGGDTPAPVIHTHTWVAHKTTIHHPEISHKVGHTYCNTCGAIVDGLSHSQHGCNGGHYTTHNGSEKVVDQAAWDQEVIDYYYCSECGARQ